MCGKKIPKLFILAFIMMFFILITTSYGSNNIYDISQISFDDIDAQNNMTLKNYFYSSKYLFILIEEILPFVNIVLLILSRKTIDFKGKRYIIVNNIISWIIVGCISVLLSPTYGVRMMTGEEEIEYAKSETILNIFGILILLVNLIWQLYMLIYIIKQRIKAKTDKIKQDV